MQYVKLNNHSYIVNLSTGLTTITTKSFNYHKIIRLIDEEVGEEEILPLLKTPDLSNGIYEAYFDIETDTLYYIHYKTHSSKPDPKTLDGVRYNRADSERDTFLGVYASIEDIYEDWPEHAI